MSDTVRSPDPVDDPQGYQRHLLGLLGDDDPTTVQRATLAEWRTLVDLAGDHLHTAPADGEWSVHGCLAHAVDAEIVMSGRYRWVLAHDEPEIVGYDQDLWVRRLHAEGRPEADELLTLFGALRASNVDLWQRSTDTDRARTGMHAERGPESYDLAFRMLAGHDRFHLGQARRALDAVSAG